MDELELDQFLKLVCSIALCNIAPGLGLASQWLGLEQLVCSIALCNIAPGCSIAPCWKSGCNIAPVHLGVASETLIGCEVAIVVHISAMAPIRIGTVAGL